MDISQENDIDRLKSLAYDQLMEIQMRERNLDAIRTRLNQLQLEKANAEVKKALSEMPKGKEPKKA